MKDKIEDTLMDLLKQVDEGIKVAVKTGDAAAIASLLDVKLAALHLWNS